MVGALDDSQASIELKVDEDAVDHVPWDFCVVFDTVTQEELDAAENDLCCWRREARLAALKKQQNFIGGTQCPSHHSCHVPLNGCWFGRARKDNPGHCRFVCMEMLQGWP